MEVADPGNLRSCHVLRRWRRRPGPITCAVAYSIRGIRVRCITLYQHWLVKTRSYLAMAACSIVADLQMHACTVLFGCTKLGPAQSQLMHDVAQLISFLLYTDQCAPWSSLVMLWTSFAAKRFLQALHDGSCPGAQACTGILTSLVCICSHASANIGSLCMLCQWLAQAAGWALPRDVQTLDACAGQQSRHVVRAAGAEGSCCAHCAAGSRCRQGRISALDPANRGAARVAAGLSAPSLCTGTLCQTCIQSKKHATSRSQSLRWDTAWRHDITTNTKRRWSNMRSFEMPCKMLDTNAISCQLCWVAPVVSSIAT